MLDTWNMKLDLAKLIIIGAIVTVTSNLYAWEKVPVPDYVNKKTKSPWNFHDNFEDQKLGKMNFRRYSINDKGEGKKPFIIKQDPNGNKFLEITVKHGWNKCCGTWVKTERAEIEAGESSRALNKEIWYGFKVRFPKGFQHIDDRVLISQFKNNHKGMKKSPLLGIRYYSNGARIDLDGDTGGIATTKYNKEEWFTHGITSEYTKGKNNEWFLSEVKKRGENSIKTSYCHLHQKPLYCKKLNDLNLSYKGKSLGEWITFKVGIKNSKKEDGFVKVFLDENLVMNYSGVTFDWKGQYKHSDIRIGIYRDSDPSGSGYPDQSIHFDDFTAVSDKKTLDKYLK